MAKEKRKVGRPTVMGSETLGKLEYAFLKGLSDRQACLYAGINPDSLYEYCKNHPDYSDRKELLKEQPKIRAKLIISDKLDEGDPEIAKWYLERRAKDEFSLRQEVSAEVKSAVRIIDDIQIGDDEE